MNQSTVMDKEINSLLRIGFYKSRDEVISDAIRNLLLNNRPLRLELAIDLYKTDDVSLGRAAEIAGIDRWQFQEILNERQIPIIIVADSAESMDEDLSLFFSESK